MTNPTIQALLVLQERDARVMALTTELENSPRLLTAADAELERRIEVFEQLRTRTRQTEAERKKIDLDVQAKQGAIARYRAQQTQTRKNEEFAALNHEIDHAQKEITALEDTELELMEAYERGQAEVAAAQKELLLVQDKTKHKKADLEKRAAHVASELSEAKAKQTEAEGTVPEDVLARYRRILKSKKDIAIVPIRGGACGGCHMKLTTQTVVSSHNPDSLTSCENCGRLVYPADS
jgi:predicted  nucleic acid-binding Zn-ribbon protein